MPQKSQVRWYGQLCRQVNCSDPSAIREFVDEDPEGRGDPGTDDPLEPDTLQHEASHDQGGPYEHQRVGLRPPSHRSPSP